MAASVNTKDVKEENDDKSGIGPLKTNGNVTNNGDTDVSGEQRTFHFVIKSPPKASFIRMMHKMTKPFLNEVTWYLVRTIYNSW